MDLRKALEICLQPKHLRKTTRIAFVVGTVLTTINQGDIILGGTATRLTWIKVGMNYVVPLIVSNLGLLAGNPPPATGQS